MSLIETKEVKFYSSVDDFPKVGNELCVADGVVYAVSGGIRGAIGGGSLSDVAYGANGPTSWNEGSTSYTATYNSDGTLATVTGGGIVKTFTYSAGQLTGVTTGAV